MQITENNTDILHIRVNDLQRSSASGAVTWNCINYLNQIEYATDFKFRVEFTGPGVNIPQFADRKVVVIDIPDDTDERMHHLVKTINIRVAEEGSNE